MLVTTSWDDGHVLDHELASVLADAGVAATFYVALENREIPAPRRLTRAAVVELAERFEIGSHTTTHPVLTAVSPAEAWGEIRGSRLELSELLGSHVTSFSYPRGRWSPGLRDAVRRAGYSYGRTVASGVTTFPVDPWAAGTTLEAARPPLWALPVAPARAVLREGVAPRRAFTWWARAMGLFDAVRASGGVFHLWGHSWVTHARGEWSALRDVLAYMHQFDDVKFVPNHRIVVDGPQSGVGTDA